MKSLDFCFKKSVVSYLMNMQVGEEFRISDIASCSPNSGVVLHRYQTPCGMVMLVKTRYDYKGASSNPRAYWLSNCGNSGQLNITSGDADYAQAVKEYHQPYNESEFSESCFASLGEMLC